MWGTSVHIGKLKNNNKIKKFRSTVNVAPTPVNTDKGQKRKNKLITVKAYRNRRNISFHLDTDSFDYYKQRNAGKNRCTNINITTKNSFERFWVQI